MSTHKEYCVSHQVPKFDTEKGTWQCESHSICLAFERVLLTFFYEISLVEPKNLLRMNTRELEIFLFQSVFLRKFL